MGRRYRLLGGILLGLGTLSVLTTWLGIWQAHRRKVERLRLVWGPDAAVPAFNPVRLFDPNAIPFEVSGGYTVASVLSIAGLLLLLLSRHRR